MNEALSKLICEAFADVKLGKGIGLQEAQGLDDYENEAIRTRYRAADEKENWSRISAEELNRCNSSLSFFDAEGMRFHLPAYLITELQGLYRFGMAFPLTNLSDYRKGQFELLSRAQRSAIRAFLLHILDDPDYEFDRPHIIRALEEFWTETTA